jgi:hypothetical protein
MLMRISFGKDARAGADINLFNLVDLTLLGLVTTAFLAGLAALQLLITDFFGIDIAGSFLSLFVCGWHAM